MIFFLENPIWRLRHVFFIEAHSSREFGGREIGLAIETEMNIYRKQW